PRTGEERAPHPRKEYTMPIQTIGEADAFFASLPDGPDAVQDFAAALPPAGAAAYIPVAGTAGKTAVASLTAGILAAAGFRTGLYRAGAGPLSERITLQGRSLGEDPAGPAAAAYLGRKRVAEGRGGVDRGRA